MTVHYIGQYWELAPFTRKIREWTTLDLVLNYTFNLPASVAQNEVAGYSTDSGKNAGTKGGKGKNVIPVSTAEYNPCGWHAWLNNITITLGMNNVFDQDPPFWQFESGYDQLVMNISGGSGYGIIVLQAAAVSRLGGSAVVAGASENACDESLATIKGRFWYVQLKKRF
jgi:outer membrane receptor protein involved in Fe transport